MAKITTISFSIPSDLLNELDRIQEETLRTRSSIINQALREFVDALNSQEGEEKNHGRE